MKISLSRTALLLAALAMSIASLASPAAADVTCAGTIGPENLDDNVIVPDGTSCTLDGTAVDGNVLVGEGASLTARGATIGGNVQDDNGNAGHVEVTASHIGGSIQLEQGTSLTVTTSRIDADLQWESNRGLFRADDNDIGGNLQANQNSGGLTITDNVIGGNLQCQANNPAPTGTGNIVHGSAEDQCAGLTGEGPSQPQPSPEPPHGDDRAACPGEHVPAGSFADTAGNPHEHNIDCVAWWGITAGVDADHYGPTLAVRRDQMASFIARTILNSGGSLPEASAHPGFPDTDGNPHETNIRRLAAAGVISGTGDGIYDPAAPVRRDQMAALLVRSYEHRTGETLTAAGDHFDDTVGSVHRGSINQAVEAGFASGTTATTYEPARHVRRDQMASFLARVLDRLVGRGFTSPPA